MTWREIARPIIKQALIDTEGKEEKDIRKHLRNVYPFGERKYHPYKIWCDEIKVQRGLKEKKSIGNTFDPNQLNLL